mgnify:CR=1 FL=1
MDSRTRLRHTLSFERGCVPPRYESEFSDDVVRAWRNRGCLDHRSPEEFFGLDPREQLGITWRRSGGEKAPIESKADLDSFRHAYDPASADRLPEDFREKTDRWRTRDFAVFGAPWNEGFLQVIGVSDSDSLRRALVALCEQPKLVAGAMEHYADYLEALLEKVLPAVALDYAVFYEPIACNKAPVVSPSCYARFVLPALRRVVSILDRHGVAFRFIWTAGQVRPLIPLWLDAGINGLHLNQGSLAGIAYGDLRAEFGKNLLLWGGVNWQAIVAGPEVLDAFLDNQVRPLLETGGYIPHMDDTVRAYMPFESFAHYRRRLDAVIAEVCGGRG